MILRDPVRFVGARVEGMREESWHCEARGRLNRGSVGEMCGNCDFSARNKVSLFGTPEGSGDAHPIMNCTAHEGHIRENKKETWLSF
ncbi:hypothetical protein CC2G_003845 [Coprinopsis cinerea AmutBmut pab1-1]|nr:hypothetical protein CC2G_003845 [Coprinopsis cinerea AmutBmut pab1-1]